jgi:sugar lactone lactonase YvrE
MTRLTHALQVFDRHGAQQRTIAAASSETPNGICFDALDRLYVTCIASRQVIVYSPGGTQERAVQVPGMPRGIAVTRRGAIVVSHQDPSGLTLIA